MDFNTIWDYLEDVGIEKNWYLLDIYPGYPHGHLTFFDINDS